MSEAKKKSYESLLTEYNQLQLRVTQFSNTEQELINARDKLDQEIVAYRRLNSFIQKALSDTSNFQFA